MQEAPADVGTASGADGGGAVNEWDDFDVVAGFGDLLDLMTYPQMCQALWDACPECPRRRRYQEVPAIAVVCDDVSEHGTYGFTCTYRCPRCRHEWHCSWGVDLPWLLTRRAAA